MRSFSLDKNVLYPLYKDIILSPFFLPHHRQDKYHNDVSEIHFPDIRYDMVHHNKPEKRYSWHQNATIYCGRDRFLKFKSYYSDVDTQMHTIEIKTLVGDFSGGWGDGDFLGLTIPDAYKDLPTETINNLKNAMETGDHEDNEILFLMRILEFMHNYEHEFNPYFNKNSWEPVKQQLVEEQKRRKVDG